MDKQYTMEDLIHIVETLRSEHGCPWDRKQTHESLRQCIMEEAAELTASIRIYAQTGDAENMCEELGDILLQVVMHAQIAKEEQLFALEDVVDSVSAKMIRRHPHVFGDAAQTENAEEIPGRWEEIKRKEKEGKTWIESPLREIPKELPALVRAPKVLKKADKLYGSGEDYYTNVMKMEKSMGRLKEFQPEADDVKLEEIIGDILLNLSDISRQFKISPEQILNDRLDDMIERYEPMQKP